MPPLRTRIHNKLCKGYTILIKGITTYSNVFIFQDLKTLKWFEIDS